MSEPIDPIWFDATVLPPWRTERTEWFWTELELIEAGWRAVAHPFFVAFAAGRLDTAAIADYAAEHDHLLVAVAQAADEAAAAADGLLHETLASHAAHRRTQIDRWRAFAGAAGWAGASWHFAQDPYETSVRCARAVPSGDGDLPRLLVTLHAFARAECEVASAVRSALTEAYGYTGERALAFFAAAQDEGAAERARIEAALEGLLPRCDPYMLLRRVERVVRCWWHVLDDLAIHNGLSSPLR
jgi:pyrroloquinoline quinone (PQQ) biosynthesis protein C